MPIIFLLFIIIPIIEITLLINVGQWIGVWYTIGLVLLSAFIGVNMLRIQGLSTLMRARQRMDQGEIPGQEMGEGIVLAVGGALLVTPGFVTDVFGFCCLIPFTRRALVRFVSQRMTVIASHQTSHHTRHHASHQDANQGPGQAPGQGPLHRPHFDHKGANHPFRSKEGDVIDGEFTRKD